MAASSHSPLNEPRRWGGSVQARTLSPECLLSRVPDANSLPPASRCLAGPSCRTAAGPGNAASFLLQTLSSPAVRVFEQRLLSTETQRHKGRAKKCEYA